MIYPFQSEQQISDPYDRRNTRKPPPTTRGVDLATRKNLPILAIEDGYMSSMFTGAKGERYFDLYTRNRTLKFRPIHIDRVVRGGDVKEGDVIAYTGDSGKSGKWVGGIWIPLPYGAPHTLISTQVNGVDVDPMKILPKPNLHNDIREMFQFPFAVRCKVLVDTDIKETPSPNSKVVGRVKAGDVFDTLKGETGEPTQGVAEYYPIGAGYVCWKFLEVKARDIPTPPSDSELQKQLDSANGKISAAINILEK